MTGQGRQAGLLSKKKSGQLAGTPKGSSPWRDDSASAEDSLQVQAAAPAPRCVDTADPQLPGACEKHLFVTVSCDICVCLPAAHFYQTPANGGGPVSSSRCVRIRAHPVGLLVLRKPCNRKSLRCSPRRMPQFGGLDDESDGDDFFGGDEEGGHEEGRRHQVCACV